MYTLRFRKKQDLTGSFFLATIRHMSSEIERIKALIIDVPNYPKEGISFKDITPMLADRDSLAESIEAMDELWTDTHEDKEPTMIAGAESRGFIFGVPLAIRFDVGFVPIRKPGKLPREIYSEKFFLEYGTDTLEVHKDAFTSEDKVLFVDDLLATGGTAEAAIKLIRQTGAEVIGACFLLELNDLGGREKLEALNVPVISVIQY